MSVLSAFLYRSSMVAPDVHLTGTAMPVQLHYQLGGQQ